MNENSSVDSYILVGQQQQEQQQEEEAGPATPMIHEEHQEAVPQSQQATPACTAAQAAHQASTWCDYTVGRHNLVHVFAILRFHLPDATLFVDIGANKGLVSARWLELWKPHLNITAKGYAQTYVAEYFAEKNVTKIAGSPCGVTNMCDLPDANTLDTLAAFSPVHHQQQQAPFEIHSIEPSPHLHEMHQVIQTRLPGGEQIQKVWKWHKIAASDYDGQVYFDSLWNEGSQIRLQPNKETNTLSARLDTLVYNDQWFGGGDHDNARIIDIIKVDAETVDLKVVAGASRLLHQGRVRVIMWEAPNNFPVEFPQFFGGKVSSYTELMDRLDVYAGMTCFFPALHHKNIKTTGCFEALAASPLCHKNCPYARGCPVDHSNALCVSRALAPALYRAMEAQALIYN